MIKSKVFEILSRLDSQSLKLFGDFVNSPFFNRSKPVVRLFNQYKKFYPKFDNEKLSKESVFKKIYPDKIYNELRFRNINSDLLNLAEKFLAIKNIYRDPLRIQMHLLHEINNLKINPLFSKCFKQAEIMLDSFTSRDSKYFYFYHWLYGEKDVYNSILEKFDAEDTLKMETGFRKYFLSTLFRIYCYLLNLKNLRGLEDKLNIDENLLRRLKSLDYTDEPCIAIPFNRIMLHFTESDEYYIKLRQLTERYGHLLERSDLYDSYIYMINYINRNKPKAQHKTLVELYQLRKSIFEKELLTSENYISYSLFLNHVYNCLQLKYYDDVYKFIYKHKDMISEKFRDSTFYLSLAFYYFKTGKLEQALESVSKVTYLNSRFIREVKCLSSQIYWMIGNEIELINQLESFKTHINHRNIFTSKQKSDYTLFIKAFETLMKIKNHKQYYNIQQLLSNLQKSNLPQSKWIIEEYNKLLK